MTRKSSKAPPPAPRVVFSTSLRKVVDPEEFLVLVEERLASICEGCFEGPSKRSPYQVVAAINRELEALRGFIEDGEVPGAEARIRATDDWRLRRPELAVALLAEARAVLPGDPERSGEWATLGRAAASLGTTRRHLEREAQALAYLANARRALSDLGGAEEVFQEAREVLQRCGAVTPIVGADIDGLESSLARDRRILDCAEELLRRALLVQRTEGLDLSAARTLVSLGFTLVERGKTEAARRSLLEALPALEGEEHHSLRLLALINLCLAETRDGHYGAAAQHLQKLQSEIENRRVPFFTSSRIVWLRARVSAGLGEEARALHLFRQVFLEMMARGVPYDALLVGLDWMRVATRRGQEDDVHFLAAHLQQISRQAPELRNAFHEAVDLLTEYLLEGAFSEAIYWIFERCLWRRRVA